MWFVYIIYSETFDIYYKGETNDPVARLTAHNKGLSAYTRGKGPWKPVYLEKVSDRRSALVKERQFKKLKARSIRNLINSPQNIVGQYFL